MDLLEVYETRRSVNFFEKGKEIPGKAGDQGDPDGGAEHKQAFAGP